MSDVRLTKSEFEALCVYNGRRPQLTPEEWWEMAVLQWRWNVDQREQYLEADFLPFPGDGGGYIKYGPGPGIETFVPYTDWNPRHA